MKNRYVLYYVEGDDEEKLINTLKSKLNMIKSGKVQKLNVVECEITDLRLRALSPGTMVVLVFDTDTGNVEILERNIKKLKACPAVSEVVTIPQVRNLEDELVNSCAIKDITELLNSRSRRDFKSDIIHVSNLDKKLQEHRFDINSFWSKKPLCPYQNIENQAEKVKQR